MGARVLLIRLATFLGGIYFFLEYLIPESVSKSWGWDATHEPITIGLIVLGNMAIGLGVLNLLLVHGKRVTLQTSGWVNSGALLCGLFATLTITTVSWMKGLETSHEVRPVVLIGQFALRILSDEDKGAADRKPMLERARILYEDGILKVDRTLQRIEEIKRNVHVGEGYSKEASETAIALKTDLGAVLLANDPVQLKQALNTVIASSQRMSSSYRALLLKYGESHWSQKLYAVVYDGLFIPLGSAMFALLGVYIAAAAFRAFRVRSFESFLLMAAAVLVMLGQMSFGEMLWGKLPAIRQWLLEVPNSAAFRAIRFGAGLAGLLLSIRMWLSIESRAFSGDKS